MQFNMTGTNLVLQYNCRKREETKL